MSRYLFRRRLTIVAAVAGVLILVPLIGWTTHKLALKTAREVRPPARVRFSPTSTAPGGGVLIEVEADAARVVLCLTEQSGYGRFTLHCGGAGAGDWSYQHRNQVVRPGLIGTAIATAGEWRPLHPGDAVLLAEVVEPGGALSDLAVWCVPAGKAPEQWVLDHPPVDP